MSSFNKPKLISDENIPVGLTELLIKEGFDVKKIPFDKFNTRWLFLDSLGGHYDLLETAVNWAVKNGVKLATDPGGKELDHGLEKLKPLLKYFSIVKMNQEEAAKLTGISYEKEEEIFKLMKIINILK